MTDPDLPTFHATHEQALEELPDPNGSEAMVGEVLPDDWTPDGDR